MLIRLTLNSLVGVLMLMACAASHAMLSLEDEALSEVNGEGMAIGTSNFRILSGATSYFEAIGQAPAAGSIWSRADARYYGVSYSGNTPASAWAGACGAGFNNMGCPIGGLIQYFMPFDNPLVIRVFDYTKIKYNGANGTLPVFEILDPTNQDKYRFSTWTELVIGGVSGNKHQGQMILTDTKLSNFSHNPATPTLRNNLKIRMYGHTNVLDPTIGFILENQYEGDFRYSVNQKFGSPDVTGAPPQFSDTDGFYAMNVRTALPTGQLFYQSLVVDDINTGPSAHDGNFVFDVTLIPNTANVYNDFYSLSTPLVAPYNSAARYYGYQRTNRPARYFETHGFFKIGSSGTTNNTGTLGATGTRVLDISDGIFFAKGDSSPTFSASANTPSMCGGCNPGANASYTYNNLSRVNIGDVNVEGMLINHLSIQTCSAGAAAC